MKQNYYQSASKIRGTKVTTLKEIPVGVIQHILVNPESGIILYLILCYASFTGHMHWHLAVPGSSVKFHVSRPALCHLDVDAHQLHKAPNISLAKMTGASDGSLMKNFKSTENFNPVCKLLP